MIPFRILSPTWFDCLSGIGSNHRTRLGIHSIVNEETESASKTGLPGISGDGRRTQSRISFGIDSLASGFDFLSGSGGNSGATMSEPGILGKFSLSNSLL